MYQIAKNLSMELIYNVALEVEINSGESSLLHKYISLHPEHRKHIASGQFAEYYNDREDAEGLQFTLTKEVLDICVAVLEDQEFGDPVENEDKKRLIDKFYSWSKIIYNEEDHLEELKMEYDCFKLKNIVSEDDYFNLKRYLSVKTYGTDFIPPLSTVNRSVFEKIRKYFSLRRIN
ncbi:hypothetical protein [Chryseobacterium arachidis]|nr:hypothetical protein [Chryseobacterium arachidis]